MTEFIFWVFAVCGAPLALAMVGLAAESVRDLFAKRRSRRAESGAGRSPFSWAGEGLGRLGP
jgi:hypothetical protein